MLFSNPLRISIHVPLSGNTTRPQNPPSPSHSHFDLGKSSSTPALSCLVLAAMVELTVSCGRSSQLSIWRRPLSFNDPYNSTKRSLFHSRVIMLPDSVVVGVVTRLLSGGGGFQGRDRGRRALYCPLSGPFHSRLVGRTPRAGYHFPGRGWCLWWVCFGPLLVISRWSYPLGRSTKGEGWFLSFPLAILVVALQCPKVAI